MCSAAWWNLSVRDTERVNLGQKDEQSNFGHESLQESQIQNVKLNLCKLRYYLFALPCNLLSCTFRENKLRTNIMAGEVWK
jgi:hypothetical protein